MLRIDQGLSQELLAREPGFSRKMIWRGVRPPRCDFRTVLGRRDVLGISVTTLLSDLDEDDAIPSRRRPETNQLHVDVAKQATTNRLHRRRGKCAALAKG